MNSFEYFEPSTVNDALSLLDRWKGQAKVIAGGTDLIPLMRSRVVTPKCLVDISRLSELEFIKETGDAMNVGALTTLRVLETSALVQETVPILAEAAGQVGSIQVRNAGTIGGSLVNASPAADVAPPLLVYEATVMVRSLHGKREIPLSEFFVGVKKTVLGENELLTDITIPKKTPRTGGGFMKIGKRNALIISIANAAASVTLDRSKQGKVRIALGAVSPTAVRAKNVESFLEGREITEKSIDEASRLVSGDIKPVTDIRASAEYRREISSVLVKRVLQRAVEKAER